MRENHKAIAPSMIYAYAAVTEVRCIPFANGAPNLTVDIPAMMSLADKNKLAICGKDFKTGRNVDEDDHRSRIEVAYAWPHGWYSTNILGNRDGEVLDDPDSFKTKEESKLSVLEYISSSLKSIPLSTRTFRTSSESTTTRRVATTKRAGTTSISSAGLATDADQDRLSLPRLDPGAPIVLDLALFLDLAQRGGMKGVQEWLSFYFKSPQTAPGLIRSTTSSFNS